MLTVTDENGIDLVGAETHIANVNPFRYRGYYYDAEIQLYYLQSRYYDPEIGRFINADDVNILFNDKFILATNLYCYCNNDVINDLDFSGAAAVLSTILAVIFVIGAVVTGILAGIRAVRELKKTRSYQRSIGGGKFLQACVHFALGFLAGSILYVVFFATGKYVEKLCNIMTSVTESLLKNNAKKITVKKFLGFVFDAYTDEMGWSFLNKTFEKGLMNAVVDELGGKLKDKFFDLILEEA